MQEGNKGFQDSVEIIKIFTVNIAPLQSLSPKQVSELSFNQFPAELKWYSTKRPVSDEMPSDGSNQISQFKWQQTAGEAVN